MRVGAGILDQVNKLHRRAIEPFNIGVFYPGQEVGIAETFDNDGMPVIKYTVTVMSVDIPSRLLELETNLPDSIKIGDFLVIK